MIEIRYEAAIGAESSCALFGRQGLFSEDAPCPKGFPLGKPFPPVHVDTTWKFQAMYAHRERMARKEWTCLPSTRMVDAGVNPFTRLCGNGSVEQVHDLIIDWNWNFENF